MMQRLSLSIRKGQAFIDQEVNICEHQPEQNVRIFTAIISAAAARKNAV